MKFNFIFILTLLLLLSGCSDYYFFLDETPQLNRTTFSYNDNSSEISNITNYFADGHVQNISINYDDNNTKIDNITIDNRTIYFNYVNLTLMEVVYDNKFESYFPLFLISLTKK
jgi:hypothetical protein